MPDPTYVNPGGTVFSYASGLATGLTGTLTFKVLQDGAGTLLAPATAGVHEETTGNYRGTVVIPGTVTASATTTYSVYWTSGGTVIRDDDLSIIVSSAPTTSTPLAGLVDEVRQLVGAGTAQYTANGTTYWTDAQLQQRLDARRSYVSGAPLEMVAEPVTGGSGAVQFKRARVCVPGRVAAGTTTAGTAASWTLQSAAGVVPSGTAVVEQDGWVTFTTDQAGAALEFYGWTYDVYGAAADAVSAWASAVKTAYDFKTDDQEFNRSKMVKQLRERAQDLYRLAAPAAAVINVPEDRGARRRTGAMTANMRRTWGS